MLSKLLGLARKAALPASYVGAGYVGSYLIGKSSENARAYYGEKEYQDRFKGYHEYAQGVSKVLGYLGGGAALFKADPISIVSNFRNIGKYNKYRKVATRDAFSDKWARGMQTGTHNRDRIVSMAEDRMKQYSPYKGMWATRAVIGTAALGAAGGIALANPLATAASTAVLGAIPAARLIKNNIGGTALIAGGIGLGAGFAMNRPIYPAGEGNITNVSYDRSSTVNRLNYSTAGLVQALYSNRKVM